METTDYRRMDLIIARTVKNLTLRQLAARVGVSRTILSRLEQDYRVDTSDVVKGEICRELGLNEFPEGPVQQTEQAVVP